MEFAFLLRGVSPLSRAARVQHFPSILDFYRIGINSRSEVSAHSPIISDTKDTVERYYYHLFGIVAVSLGLFYGAARAP